MYTHTYIYYMHTYNNTSINKPCIHKHEYAHEIRTTIKHQNEQLPTNSTH